MHLLYTSKMDIIGVHRDGKACNALSIIIVVMSVGPDTKIFCEQKYIITKNYVFVVLLSKNGQFRFFVNCL